MKRISEFVLYFELLNVFNNSFGVRELTRIGLTIGKEQNSGLIFLIGRSVLNKFNSFNQSIIYVGSSTFFDSTNE